MSDQLGKRYDSIGAFKNLVSSDEDDNNIAVICIKVLVDVIRNTSATTVMELRKEIKDAVQDLRSATGEDMSMSLTSASELFVRFVTRMGHEQSFEQYRRALEQRGEVFMTKAKNARKKVAKMAVPFIRDGAKILVHSRSRMVLTLLTSAAKDNRRFEVYITEARPDFVGLSMAKDLSKAGIPVTIILDAAVGCMMQKVDLVVVGAEGVVENGGIINRVGTNSIAHIAKAYNKPFYVAAESFKFVRMFPLTQDDITEPKRRREDILAEYQANGLEVPTDVEVNHPMLDYTPPDLITLLFTDIGVLTPSAVSDELIKLYS
eukprot:Clim_evm59s55 gene=Clim_evmTU59s55